VAAVRGWPHLIDPVDSVGGHLELARQFFDELLVHLLEHREKILPRVSSTLALHTEVL
jgi:hypothetical protein